MIQVAIAAPPTGGAHDIAFEALNDLLGGSFTSRINMNLREDKGYTYGAFSTFQTRQDAGPFYVSAGVRTEATAPAVTEIYNEIKKMKETLIDILVDATGKNRDELAKDIERDFYLSAGQAKEYGLIDEVLERKK